MELFIQNEDGNLLIQWTDLENSLSCTACPMTIAQPVFDTQYGVLVANEFCTDSLTIFIEIEKNRRIYAPNVFSPNGDGINDFFYLQTPDFGVLHYLNFFDRWGSLIYATDKAMLNEATNGWDGGWRGQQRYDGVFIWEAEIEFIDETKSVFAGSVIVLK
ncbi:MAG: gliding motility-associated-like protein [Paraglaciecola sp.]